MRILSWPFLILGLVASCGAQTCSEGPIQTESAASASLRSHNPEQGDAASGVCITEAISVLSQLRSATGIPQLIRYLQYHRPLAPGEASGFFLHPQIEGNDYPAVLALARVGPDARESLLRVVESAGTSHLERRNAAHAIVLSYLLGKDRNPAEGVAFLKAAITRSDKASQGRLKEAIESAVGTPACKRVAPKCEKAAQ